MRQEVEDALRASASERMAAAVALLDAVYELWRTRGMANDTGLCRFPRCAQQRRRGLCSDRRDGGTLVHPYRTTRDLDVLIEPTADNAARARRAVARWGGFEPVFSVEDFLSGDILSFGGLLRVEIHSRVPGASWEEVWAHRVDGELLGVPAPFAGLDELIAMKAATGTRRRTCRMSNASARSGSAAAKADSSFEPRACEKLRGASRSRRGRKRPARRRGRMRAALFRKKSIEQIQRDAEEGIGTDHGPSSGEPHLRRTLTVVDLTAFGIAAIIGAGIFSAIGKASFNGGPAVILLFVFTAMACGFSALCYAEFASRVPIAGSAYTYAYASFGELVAWIIGWDLLIEYAIGNIAVAISWSDYFTGLLSSIRVGSFEGIHLPAWMTMDYLSAARGHAAAVGALGPGASVEALAANPDTARLADGFTAWTTAPQLGGLRSSPTCPRSRSSCSSPPSSTSASANRSG